MRAAYAQPIPVYVFVATIKACTGQTRLTAQFFNRTKIVILRENSFTRGLIVLRADDETSSSHKENTNPSSLCIFSSNVSCNGSSRPSQKQAQETRDSQTRQ